MSKRLTPERQQEQVVLALLRRHAARLADSFRLPLRRVDAESARVKRRYGVCYDDGTIKIRLRSVRSGELLRESSLVDTLCHELAHLRHFDHGPRFWRLYQQILEYARRHGVYRPGQPSRWRFPEPEQRVAERPAPRARPRPPGRPAPPLRPPGGEQLELF